VPPPGVPPPLSVEPSSPLDASSPDAASSPLVVVPGLDASSPPLLGGGVFKPVPLPPLLLEPPPLLLLVGVGLLLLVVFAGGVFSDARLPVPLPDEQAATTAAKHTPNSIL
jgi:hypothetical protein